MIDNVKIEKQEDYLLVTISDIVITNNRAHEILSLISEQCTALKCKKVLLDERTVESREVSTTEILKLSIEMVKKGLHKNHIAFWCKSRLINKDSILLRLFTHADESVIQYFTERNEAEAWLKVKGQS